jgi:hypothetical protein
MHFFRFFPILLLFFPPPGAAQAQKPSSQHGSARKSSLATHAGPVAAFDKLEFFAFLAAGPFPLYAAK